MSGSILSLVMNGVIIVLLCVTIVFAARLSLYLKAFRDNRKEIDKLIKELGAQFEKADHAITGLRQASKDVGKGLSDRINEARALSDELQLIVQSGNKLAGRIEKVSDNRGVRAADPTDATLKKKRKEPPRGLASPPQPSKSISGFELRDPEFGRDDMDGGPDDFMQTGDDSDDGNTDDALHSRAERDLAEAMRKRSRKPSGGR